MGSLKSERIDSTETTISKPHTVSSFRSKYVLFLTEKPFPSCFWATCLFFFINSTFNLCPGVIACITGVIFWRFSGDRRQARSERGALPPSLVFLSHRPLPACLSWPKKTNKHRQSCRLQLELQ